jgi:hypothetical protein
MFREMASDTLFGLVLSAIFLTALILNAVAY